MLIILSLLFTSCRDNKEKTPADYVDPFIGTDYHGHVFPGAALPFGMVQLSPDNGTSGWDWCSGYHYSDSVIAGFGHTHLSGTGIGDLADIVFLPSMKEFNGVNDDETASMAKNNRSVFDHANEEAEPGYYSVELDNGVKVELTATERAGMQKYIAQNNGSMNVLIDLGFAINWDKPVDCSLDYRDGVLHGKRISSGWAKRQYQYFASRFSAEPDEIRYFVNGMPHDGESAEGTNIAMVLTFNVNDGDEILVKTGLSAVDSKGALANLDREIIHWNFETTRKQALETWNDQLSAISANSHDPDILTVFYTALYHSMLAPCIYSDTDGRYRGADGNIHQSDDFVNYTVFSLWDTFRSAHPLFTLTEPGRVTDMVNAMLKIYEQQGKLPVWSLMANETNTMIGYHAVPVIADAMVKNIKGFDYEKAYQAALHSSMLDEEGLDHYRDYKYIPADLENESVSKTLEYCYDDWCIAMMADILGKEDDYNYYMERASYYRNLFDPESGFMRGKLENGEWKEDFDPLFSSHRQDEYTEGNAWQYTWFVPHDVEGLIDLFGGRDAFLLKLDSLFLQEKGVRGENASSDISGLIGAYAHGNEPGHHTAYMFTVAGKPGRTEELVRRIMTEMYHTGKDGLCGNEDCGQMSAWYVLSAMGIYPFNPADGKFVLGSPLLDEAVISLDGDNEFVIRAENNSKENIYVDRVLLNGKELERNYITYSEIMKGGSLLFKMSKEKK